MNQPTREEFEAFKAEMREEVRKLKEQRTDEMKAIRVDVASKDVLDRLDELEQETTKRIDSIQEDTNVLKIQMQGARADVLQLKESQADLRDTLKEHSEDLKEIIKEQEAHKEVLGQLLTISEEIKTTMVTKDDIKDMATKSDISSIKSTQEKILKLLEERNA